MEEKKLNKILKDRAVELGLCDKWRDEWERDETKQELIEKYLRGIDFCIQHDYPKLEFIREYFPKKLLDKNGVFVDEEIGRRDDVAARDTVVLLGGSKAELHYDGLGMGNIYVRHQSEVTIVARGWARVFVECYEDSVINVTAEDESKVFVYQHGGKVAATGNVIVRDRLKKES